MRVACRHDGKLMKKMYYTGQDDGRAFYAHKCSELWTFVPPNGGSDGWLDQVVAQAVTDGILTKSRLGEHDAYAVNENVYRRWHARQIALSD